MKFFLMLWLLPKLALSFVEPNTIRCETRVKFSGTNKFGEKVYDVGKHIIPLTEISVLKIADAKGTVAKLYPHNGLDSVLIQKDKYKVESDDLSFWKLRDKSKLSVIDCELVND